MGKRCLTLVLALLLALSLSACGSQPDSTTPPTGSGGENDSASPTPASHDTTYWTAVRYESYNPSFGRTEVSAMPTEKWWADLYLNEDGTALFREALGFGYASYLINAEWWLGADNALRLTGEDLDGSFISMDGRKEKDGSVMLETPYGNRFYFEPAERPVSGGELCMADLEGTWRMSASEVEGDEFSPEEMHMASLLNIERWWSDDEGGYTLRADYYYRWERELLTGVRRNGTPPSTTMAFAELPAPKQVSRNVSERCATLHIGSASLDIYSGCDAEQLKMLGELLRLC